MEYPPHKLNDLLSYNPETGDLTWKRRSVRSFKKPSAAISWNGQWVGKTAFRCVNPRGQRCGGIAGKTYLAHRVVWAIVHGVWAKHPFSFANGDASDLRLANIVPHPEDTYMSKSVRYGYLVRYHKGKDRWVAQYRHDGRVLSAGSHKTREEAIEAAMKAR